MSKFIYLFSTKVCFIQVIKLYAFKLSNTMQTPFQELYGFKYSYLILIILNKSILPIEATMTGNNTSGRKAQKGYFTLPTSGASLKRRLKIKAN